MKSKHDVWAQQSRRRFLADTALGAAGLGLGAAGMESAQAQTKWEKMIKGLQTVTTDVLIVGSGAAGTMAAIEAMEAGVNTIVLEKTAHPFWSLRKWAAWAEVPSFLAVLWPYQGRPCSELWGLMTHPSTLRMI